MNVIEFKHVEDRQLAARDVWSDHPDLITRSRNLNGLFYLCFRSVQSNVDITELLVKHEGVLKPELSHHESYSMDGVTGHSFAEAKRKALF